MFTIKEKEYPMAKNQEYLDICTSCFAEPDCPQSAELRHPIWFCNEFDTIKNSVDKDTKSKPNASHSNNNDLISKTKEKETRIYKGLCVNCENQKTCMLTIPEGGVWHCEEYQ